MSGPPYSYGTVSRQRLDQCHQYLQILFDEVIRDVDIIILEGHRTKAVQNRYFDEGRSKVRWPNSKHNSKPSMAVDYAPYPVDWNRLDRFTWVGGQLKSTWERLKRERRVEGYLRFGFDWDGDGDITDHTFMDYPHVELHLPDDGSRMA